MVQKLKDDFFKTPLGIVALFVCFIEIISTVTLKFLLDSQSIYLSWFLLFIIIFPSLVMVLFFLTLWFKRESFYTPNDFQNDEGFLSLFKQIEKLEIKQKALSLDPNRDFANFSQITQPILSDLISKNEILTAIYLGKSALRSDRFKESFEIFEYLRTAVDNKHSLYSRILGNLAYSLINIGDYSNAIEYILKVKQIRSEDEFFSWHALSLAYSYFKIAKPDECNKWIEYAKQRKEYMDNLEFSKKLYPEISSQL